MSAQEIVGIWRLKAYTVIKEGGPARSCLSETPFGYITYTDSGVMSVMLWGECEEEDADLEFGQTMFGVPSLSSLTIPAGPNRVRTSLGYTGRYTVQNNMVTHQVKILVPGYADVGGQPREFKVVDNELILNGATKGATYRIVWERVS